jgi:hypothetical protein
MIIKYVIIMSWSNMAKKNTINTQSLDKIVKQDILTMETNKILEKYDSDINDIIWELLCDLKETSGLLITKRNHYALLRNIYENHIDMDKHINDETNDEINDETYEDFVSWNKNRFAYN